MCDITAVTSGKGGAGKTMFAVNMASILAMRGRRVLLIDMNTGMRNLDICLGLENQVIFDLSDVISGICKLKKALVREKRFRSLYLLSTPQICGKAKVKPEHMKILCEGLGEKFDNIIIDTPAGLGDEWVAAVSQATSAVMVMSQEYASLRCNGTLENSLNDLGISSRYAVINKVVPSRSGSKLYPSFEDISQSTRAVVVGIIQEDPAIYQAMNAGLPVVCSDETGITKNLIRICDRIF